LVTKIKGVVAAIRLVITYNFSRVRVPPYTTTGSK
jgi:hypothetical protein